MGERGILTALKLDIKEFKGTERRRKRMRKKGDKVYEKGGLKKFNI